MARIVASDYQKFCTYISLYRLDCIIGDDRNKRQLSSFHKKYYGYLVLIEELRTRVNDSVFTEIVSKAQFEFLQESCSDVGQALFLVVNGCYKGAKLFLRSSIENFIKGMSLDEDGDIITTKSVYEVFEKAKATSAFADSKRELHSTLHNVYAQLCKDVHTADIEHMTSLSALNQFPNFDTDKFMETNEFASKLIKAYITIAVMKFNEQFHKFAYENKEIVSSEIIRKYRKTVNNLE